MTFWDADDLMPPGRLRFLRERLSSDPGLVAAAAGIVENEPRDRGIDGRRGSLPGSRIGRAGSRCATRLVALPHDWSERSSGPRPAKEAGGFDDAEAATTRCSASR